MKFTDCSRASRSPLAVVCSVVLVIASLPLFPSVTRAFIPTTLNAVGGVMGRSHVRITYQAVKELDRAFFGVTKLTKSMSKAMEQIGDANAEVDKDQKTASKHVDGESFPEAQTRLIDRLNGVINALNREDAEGARKELGAALHTIQDFYSHSNWIELGNIAPHPGLGRPGHAINRLPPHVPTCKRCAAGLLPPPVLCPDCSTNLIADALTSGYYGGEDPPFDVKPLGKCSHGGLLDSSADGIFGEGINKDTLACDFSPHNFLHWEAAHVAEEATKQFIRDISARVTPRQLKLLLGVGPTLAIAIDTTGSMGSIIEGVKEQAIRLVDERLGGDEEPVLYVLSPFNDPAVGPLTVTTDPEVFKSAIRALSADGGDDCPELAQTGMLDALSASDRGGDLFMFTDATSKDAALAPAVSGLATKKDIRVYPILFGSCSPIDPAYIRVADDSGGQLFFLSPSEAGSITRLADFIVRSNAVNVLLASDTSDGGAHAYTVPVDSTMTRATFSVSGATSVVVTRPGGAAVRPSDPDVSSLSLSGGMIYSIVSPAAGDWGVSVSGSGDYTVKVSGESTLDLSSFRFVELGGRPGHQGFFPIDGLPLAGQEGTVDAVVSGDFGSAQFDLRSRSGAALQALALTPVPETADEFSGKVTPPDTPFLVYLTGQDAGGNRYQRVLSATIRPQTVKIDAPASQDLRPGQALTYRFKVTNLGAPDTFAFSGSDDRDYLTSVSPTTFSLGANETKEVAVQLRPPASATPGVSDTLTVNVVGTGPTGASNFAVVTSVVGSLSNQPPDTGGARAGVGSLGPPNHKLTPVSIAGVTDPDGDPVTIRIDRIAQDEPADGKGDSDACPDAFGVGMSVAQLRAERSGAGDGRVYTIFFTASDGNGGSSQGSVKVCVPRNGGAGCADEGPSFDSTSCP